MLLMHSWSDFIGSIFPRRKQSVWVGVLGKKQSGKTSLSLLVMETLHRLGLMDGFGSNIPIENAPFHIDFIEDFRTLEQRCKMLNPKPSKTGIKRYFFFASEMGKWLPKDQSWRNVEFIEKLQTVRKYGLSWIGDAIDRVDARALNPTHFDGQFFKLGLTVAKYENWGTGEETTLRRIPDTSLEFDTWYSANFYMEPTDAEDTFGHLNESHKIVKEYLKTGSWKQAGVRTQEGKRELFKVLEYHFTHCLHEQAKESAPLEPIDSEIDKGSVPVTE